MADLCDRGECGPAPTTHWVRIPEWAGRTESPHEWWGPWCKAHAQRVATVININHPDFTAYATAEAPPATGS